jgi:hypothetical protein
VVLVEVCTRAARLFSVLHPPTPGRGGVERSDSWPRYTASCWLGSPHFPCRYSAGSPKNKQCVLRYVLADSFCRKNVVGASNGDVHVYTSTFEAFRYTGPCNEELLNTSNGLIFRGVE